ncbi:MAG TPA: hypothetical protein DET46_00965 [Comamonadaceae bacterium]|nr:MAG: hypothetical protein A3F76_05520 [Burkholderiales bacterium RIFCSPLOWO2_12_FULL_65_40]HCE27544.1 hypothetical protein [Comamonadaceae bacterium]
MSRHILRLVHEGRNRTVVAGYDRPLRTLFLHVLQDGEADSRDEVLIYDSELEPELDWSDVNVVADKLTALGIEPPAGLIEGIFLDQCFNAGNRVVEHHLDRPPSVLHAG